MADAFLDTATDTFISTAFDTFEGIPYVPAEEVDEWEDTTDDQWIDTIGALWDDRTDIVEWEDTADVVWSDLDGDEWAEIEAGSGPTQAYRTKLYIDGVLIGTFNSSSDVITADTGGSFIGQLQTSLGAGFDVNKALDGQISKTRFYRSPVEQSKVTELFNELKAMPAGQSLYYTMDELVGTTVKDYENSYDGTIVGGVTVEDGLVGGCFNFDGTGYINLDSYIAAISAGTTMFGLSFFLNTTTKPITQQNAIFSMHDNAATTLMWVGIQTDGKLFVNTPDLGDVDIDVGNITDGEWQKVLVVFYENSCYLYINKQIINISRIAGFGSIMNLVTKVSIGQEYDAALATSDFYTGKLDEFRIFTDTDISSAEEHYLYELGFPVPGTTEKRLNSFLNLKMRSTRDTYDSFRDFDFNINRSGYGYGYGNNYGE